jgi:hypothetical protein
MSVAEMIAALVAAVERRDWGAASELARRLMMAAGDGS